jgi:hypothetical protein
MGFMLSVVNIPGAVSFSKNRQNKKSRGFLFILYQKKELYFVRKNPIKRERFKKKKILSVSTIEGLHCMRSKYFQFVF